MHLVVVFIITLFRVVNLGRPSGSSLVDFPSESNFYISPSLLEESCTNFCIAYYCFLGSHAQKYLILSCRRLYEKSDCSVDFYNLHFTLVLHLLLILCGDIELNPGPGTPRFPCGICSKAVKNNDPAVCCDACNNWIHNKCCGLDSAMYSKLMGSNCSWVCYNCGLPNFSDSFFHDFNTSSILHENSFACLSQASETGTNDNNLVFHDNHNRSTSNSKKKSSEKIKLLSFNINSIRNKGVELEEVIHTKKPDIFLVQETKLDASISNAEFSPKGFNIFRKDRTDKGGGVLIGVKDSIKFVECPEFDSTLELIWIKLLPSGHNVKPIYIGCCYRPPGSDIEFSSSLREILNKIYFNTRNSIPHIILCGDFNFPNIKWDDMENNSPCPSTGGQFFDLISDFALEQQILEPTRFDLNTGCRSTLDLAFTSFPSKVHDVAVEEMISDHCIISFYLDCQLDNNLCNTHKIYLYDKGDYHKIRDDLSVFKDNFFASNPYNFSTEINWCTFRDTLHKITEKHVPSKLLTVKQKRPPWLTRDKLTLINKRNRLAKIAKTTQNEIDRKRFCSYRNFVTKELRKAHQNYVHKVIDNLGNDPRGFYRYTKSKRNEKCGIPTLHHQNNVIIDDKSKADCFNNYFQSVFTRDSGTTHPNLGINLPSIPDFNISVAGVSKLLCDINPKKSSGPDNISNRVLKEAHNEIAPVLTFIFNQSLSTSELPEDWMQANIFPLHKKGSKCKPENYRPISLTSVCCKLLEHIIYTNIYAHLDKFKVLTPYQHGFRSRHSCTTQILSAYSDWCLSLDRRIRTDVAIFDFSKAFDSVSHRLLLYKLECYGIRGKLLSWIKNFLAYRNQRVQLNGQNSDWLSVISGVPQGSVLGPLLFLIFINDIVYGLNCSVRLFADDLIIYKEIYSSNDVFTFQNDINKLYNWSNHWCMKFNIDKCKVISITKMKYFDKPTYKLGNSIMENVTNFNYLGVHITTDLNWNTHINYVVNKANKTLNFLRRNINFCSVHHKSLAYTSLVRPLLEYGCPVWDPYTQKHIDAVAKVQRRAARFVLNDYNWSTSVTHLQSRLNWPPLDVRRKILRCSEFQKIVSGISPISYNLARSNSHTRNSYNGLTYINILSSTNTYKFSFFPRTISDWNSLPVSIRYIKDNSSFVKALRAFYLSDM